MKNNRNYSIIISYKGDTTTAMLVDENFRCIKSTTAKRNPNDKPSLRIGAQVAFERLWEKKEKPKKPAEKGGFKVGDRVVVVDFHCQEIKGLHGCVATFGKYCDKKLIGVELDHAVALGHKCNMFANDHKPHAKDGHGLWFKPIELRHENPTQQKVREVKRQAKAGEYIKLTKKMYSFDKVGLILRVDKVDGCALVLQKNHPTSNSNFHRNPEFAWAYGKYGYVVLESYQPGRDSK